MYTVWLTGSYNVRVIPDEIVAYIYKLSQVEGVRFIVGDSNGVERAYHNILSLIGAKQKSEVYSLDAVRSNVYELPVRMFTSYYDSDTLKVAILPESIEEPKQEDFDRAYLISNVQSEANIKEHPEYKKFLHKQMLSEANFAICVWDGTTKVTKSDLISLNIREKQYLSWITQDVVQNTQS